MKLHQAAHKTTAGEILCERQVITEIIYITLFHVGSYNSHYTLTFARKELSLSAERKKKLLSIFILAILGDMSYLGSLKPGNIDHISTATLAFFRSASVSSFTLSGTDTAVLGIVIFTCSSSTSNAGGSVVFTTSVQQWYSQQQQL
jgi:hypothetical protein